MARRDRFDDEAVKRRDLTEMFPEQPVNLDGPSAIGRRGGIRRRAGLAPTYAKHPGWCFRCHGQIGVDDPIYVKGGEWAHRKCAPGADDE